MPQDRRQPLGALGVLSRYAMFDHPPIREQSDGHDYS